MPLHTDLAIKIHKESITTMHRLQRAKLLTAIAVTSCMLGLVLSITQPLQATGYNDHVLTTIHDSQAMLAQELGPQTYAVLANWIEQQWTRYKQQYGMAQATGGGRTYTVFATQYAAHSNYEVAIPDKCIKFANLGWSLAGCPTNAYARGENYAVKLRHNGYTFNNAPDLDVGPWNIDDNYWAKPGDPQYRRRFSDLPTGMPEAQAAYFDNYNNGRDQYDRIVLNPAGIDLSDGVRRQLGLGYLQNAWIQVTFTWISDTVFLPQIAS